MKIINANAFVINDNEIDNKLKLVERIGRTCYKSEDLITEDSYMNFCLGLAKRKHYAMLEHAVFTIAVKKNNHNCLYFNVLSDSYNTEKYCTCSLLKSSFMEEEILITANLRAIIENNDSFLINFLSGHYPYMKKFFSELDCKINTDDLFDEYIKNDDIIFFKNNQEIIDRYKHHHIEYIAKHLTYTAYFQCDRGVTHELVRHRPCSFAQSSTRYCNYSKGKFGEEITVIKPLFFDNKENILNYYYWEFACKEAEKSYMNLLKHGAKPEEARSVLPNSLASEIWITTNGEEWQHILNLRYYGITGNPHPQMIEVMTYIHNDFAKICPALYKRN